MTRGEGPPAAAARTLGSPYVLWTVLALPAVYTGIAWWRGATFYGEVLHASGDLAAQLVIVTLAVTPLKYAFPRARFTRWLRRSRRYFGVAAFGYAFVHAVVYLQRQADLSSIVDDAAATAMWTGWLALIVMLPLAATSNDASVRRLGRRWQLLHRLVYPAAVLTFAHWILTAFDPVPGSIHAGVLAAIVAIRLWLGRRRRRAIPAGQPSR